MASPNSTFTEIVTTTLRHRNKQLADNVSNSNALLAALNQRGRVKPVAGGRTIVEELEYAENSTFKYYSGYETLDVSPSDVFTAAEYEWKQAAVNITASGLETRIQNASREATINLLESRIRNAEKTMANQLSTGIYSDGTGTGGKQIGGLQSLVADAGTGTVGGINSTTYTFWKNQTSGNVASADTDTTILANEMRAMWLECSRGQDRPDLIVAGQSMFETFWESLTDIQRLNQPEKGVAGFRSLMFVDAPVVFDGGPHGGGIGAARMYFLNTDYLYWRPHSGTNMVPLERRDSINQDAFVVPLVFAGNLTCSNRSLQGIVFT
jgi:hypothetical protein